MTDKAKWKRYEMQARVIRALAHPIRVAIVELLGKGEVCVCDIAQRVGAERSNVSRHLAVMLQADVVKTRKDGLQVFYSLRTPCVLNLLGCVSQTLKKTLKDETRALSRR